jgi:hypothetical protein
LGRLFAGFLRVNSKIPAAAQKGYQLISGWDSPEKGGLKMKHLFSIAQKSLTVLSLLASAVTAQISQSLPCGNIRVSARNGVAVFSGAPLYAKPGQPALPYSTLTFLLPAATEMNDVTIELEDVIEADLEGVYYVKPGLPPVYDSTIVWPSDRSIINRQDVAIYESDAFFPARNLGSITFGAMRQYKLVEVTIWPYRYNPVTSTLRKLTGGKVVVRGVDGSEPAVRAPMGAFSENSEPTHDKTIERLRALVVNQAAIASYQHVFSAAVAEGPGNEAAYQGTRQAPGADAPVASSDRYIIMTTHAIAEASRQLSNFVAVKQDKGFLVEVITENTWGGGIGDSAAENIRNYLKSRYLDDSIAYVLLIGDPRPDSSEVPMKTCWPRSWANPSDPNRFTETDFYYAELSGSWDSDTDGLYGEEDADYYYVTSGADKYAEVTVGRIPVYNNEIQTLDKILLKTMAYETAGASQIAWRKNMLLPFKPSDATTPGFQLGEAIKNDFCIPNQWDYYRIYDTINSFTGSIMAGISDLNPQPETIPCLETKVIDAWRKTPFGCVVWWSHGWYAGATEIATSPSVMTLNDTFPSITFQVSCNNAQPDSIDNIAYTLLTNGGIATVASTRVSWYWIGETEFSGQVSTSNSGMAYQFTKYITKDGLAVGDALNAVKGCMEPYGMWMNWLNYNVYGDPSISINSSSSEQEQSVFAVNCGGGAYTAADNTLYAEDENFSGGNVSTSTIAIANTDDATLFKSKRWGECSYSIPNLPSKRYEIKFHFAETFWNRANARKFDVVAEGRTIISQLDIFAAAGGMNKALDIAKVVQVSDGTLDISFTNATIDQPVIGAFVVNAILPTNQPPLADAGPDRTVEENMLVTLDGRGSSDPDCGPHSSLSYTWKQMSGESVDLSNPLSAQPTFTPSVSGAYTFRLTVCDGAVSSADNVTITASNSPITYLKLPGRLQAEDYIGNEFGVSGYFDVTKGNLGGQYRNDDVDILACMDSGGGYTVGLIDAGEWLSYRVRIPQTGYYTFTARVASAKAGVKNLTVSVDGADAAVFTFVTDAGWQSWVDVSTAHNVVLTAGNHILRMRTASGGFNLNYLNVIAVPNMPPVANAGDPRTVLVGETVTLNGLASYDPDKSPRPLMYSWAQVTGPGLFIAGDDHYYGTLKFVPSQPGAYTFRLTVSDGSATATTDDVVISASQFAPYDTSGNTDDFTGRQLPTVDTTESTVVFLSRIEPPTVTISRVTTGINPMVAPRMVEPYLITSEPVELPISRDDPDAMAATASPAGFVPVSLSSENDGISDGEMADNLLLNGDFEKGFTAWNAFADGNAVAFISNQDGSADIDISQPGETQSDLQINQRVSLQQGKTYTLDFDLQNACRMKGFTVVIGQNTDGSSLIYQEREFGAIAADSPNNHYSITWTQPFSDLDAEVRFLFGTAGISTCQLDNIFLK